MATAVKPRIKLDKKEAKNGDIVEVKALVSHVMETGQRKDAQGNTIPRKILNKFTCTVAGKQVFAADFEPAISANPYIQFKFKATESGPVVLTWTDDDGSTIVGEETIKVELTPLSAIQRSTPAGTDASRSARCSPAANSCRSPPPPPRSSRRLDARVRAAAR